MKTYIYLVALTVFSFGCATQNEKTVLTTPTDTDLFREQIICPRLLAEPIPFPTVTPFDLEPAKLEAYRNGFHRAWDYVVSGMAFHATLGNPKPMGMEEAWDAGWKDGNKTAYERWQQEAGKLWMEESSRFKSSP